MRSKRVYRRFFSFQTISRSCRSRSGGFGKVSQDRRRNQTYETSDGTHFFKFLLSFLHIQFFQGLDAEADEAISMISDVTNALTSTVHPLGAPENIDVSKQV
jgi:hypothetical protein